MTRDKRHTPHHPHLSMWLTQEAVYQWGKFSKIFKGNLYRGTTGAGLVVNKDAAGKPVVDETKPKTTI